MVPDRSKHSGLGNAGLTPAPKPAFIRNISMIPSRIDHFGLNVSNLDESIAFYARLFGFSVIGR